MLREALEVFEQLLQKENGERLVLDAHIPKDGTYRLIEMQESDWCIKKTLDISYDKKEGKLIGMADSDFRLIQELDYSSKLVEMNKPIDPKKVIHSNNFFTLFVKKDSILNHKLTVEIIKNYYNILRNPVTKYEKKTKAKQLYEAIDEKFGKPDDTIISAIENYVLNHNIWEGIDLEKKNYIKIFFIWSDKEKTRKYYRQEGERYLIPNIYNSNDFNMQDCDEIVGLPNNNMGMNSKKPYLENKTRKVKVPYLLNQEEVLLQAKLFDYFMAEVSQGRGNIYVDNDEEEPGIRAYSDIESPDDLESGYYFRCSKEKNEVAIMQADTITEYSKEIEPLYLKNYIEIPDKVLEKSKIGYDKAYNKLWEVKGLIDALFFQGKMKYNFYTKASDINIQENVLKRCLLQSRDAFANWFWRGDSSIIESVFDKVSLDLIKNSIRQGQTFAAQRQFNLRWSLLNYLNSERRIGENMCDVRSKLREHINSDNNQEWVLEDDKEYAYAVGQAVSYLLFQSKANIRPEAFINPFLNAKNVKVIQNKLMQMYKKYNYRIVHNNGGRVQQLLSHLIIAEPKVIYREYIMAGFVAASLIYEKREENSNE